MAGFFLPFTLLLQIGLGYEIITAALTGIPTAVGIALSIGLFGQKLIPKLGRYALSVGAIVMAIGLAITYITVQQNGLDTAPLQFTPGLLITGLGMGLIMAPIFALVLTDVDPRHAGSASGVMNAVQQLGGAIGIALIGVIFFGQLSHNAEASFTSVESNIRNELTAANIPEQMQSPIIEGAKECYTDSAKQKDASETPESCKALEGQPANPMSEKIGSIIEESVKKANADNFANAFRAGLIYEGILIAVTFVMSFMLPRHIRPEAMQAGH
jgi:hypothetical protein